VCVRQVSLRMLQFNGQYDSGAQVYEIDEKFVQDLIAASFNQLGFDSARLEIVGGSGPYAGYFKLANVVSGDLADVLGLQTDDILISVNNYVLGTLDDRFFAYAALKSETDFFLNVRRSANTVRFSYEIVN